MTAPGMRSFPNTTRVSLSVETVTHAVALHTEETSPCPVEVSGYRRDRGLKLTLLVLVCLLVGVV
jgi:hypothetical protein